MEQVNKLEDIEVPIGKVSKQMRLRVWALSRAKKPSAKELWQELGLEKEPVYQSEIRGLANKLSQQHLRAKEAVYTKFARFFRQQGFKTTYTLLGFQYIEGSGIGIANIPLKDRRDDIKMKLRPFSHYQDPNGFKIGAINNNSPSLGYHNLRSPPRKVWSWDTAPILRVLFSSVEKDIELRSLLIECCGSKIVGFGARRAIKA